MRVLDLSLTYHWYDMIASGIKKEEYREIKWFYWNRLVRLDKPKGEKGLCYRGCVDYYQDFKPCLNCKCMDWQYYDAIRFHRGQGGKQTMLVEFKGCHIGKGNPDWGAPDYPVFILSLGEILEEKK